MISVVPNVKLYARITSPSSEDSTENSWKIDDNSITVKTEGNLLSQSFDKIFQNAPGTDIYNQVYEPIVTDFKIGRNGLIVTNEGNENLQEFISMTISDVFKSLQNEEKVDITVQCSIFAIVDEVIIDLTTLDKLEDIEKLTTLKGMAVSSLSDASTMYSVAIENSKNLAKHKVVFRVSIECQEISSSLLFLDAETICDIAFATDFQIANAAVIYSLTENSNLAKDLPTISALKFNLDTENELSSEEELHGQKKRRRIEVDEVIPVEKIHKKLEQSIKDLQSSDFKPEDVLCVCSELWEEISFLKLEYCSNLNELEEQSHKLVDIRKKLNDTIARCHELELGTKDKSRLQDKCEELEQKCAQLLNEMASVEEALMDDMARMNQENEDLKEKMKILESSFGSKQCFQCAQVNEQLECVFEALSILEEAASKAPKAADFDRLEIDYHKKIDILMAEKEALDKKIESLNEDLRLRDGDIVQLMDKLGEIKKNERNLEEKYEIQIANLEHDNKTLQAKVGELDGCFAELKESNTYHELQIKEKNDQINLLQSDLTLKTNELSDQVIRLQSMSTQFSEAEKTIRDLNESINLSSSTIVSLQTQLQQTVKDLEVSKSSSEASAGKISNLEAVVKELEDRLVEERLLVRDFRQKVDDLQAKISDYESAQHSIEASAKRISELETELALKEEDLVKVTDFWKSQVSALQVDHQREVSELKESLSSVDDLLAKNETARSKIEILQQDVSELRSEKENISLLLKRSNEQKEELAVNLEEAKAKVVSLENTAATNAVDKSSDIMLRIELEKTRESFKKEKRLLQLRISELEDELSCKATESNNEVDLLAKIKRLEEENFRVSQLHQANINKLDYYTSIINKSKAEAKENSVPRDQAFGKL